MNDTYHTLAAAGRAEHTVDGSRFLAEAVPVTDRAAADETFTAIRSREHKASHHCYAYRLGVDGDTFRYDDDGEPSGTAGQPILRQMDANDLTNTLVVVARYFGGTELGTGGLARAYGAAASAALEQAERTKQVVRATLRIQYDYDDTSPAERVLQQFDADVHESEYTEVTTRTVGVRKSEVDAFVDVFRNALSGRGEIVLVGEATGENRG